MTNLELYHYGIKNMKWGERRYQNKDGSLTTEGERRYYGKMHDDEFDPAREKAKEKLRELHTGLKASPETRKKLSEIHSGENHHYYGAYGPKHGKYGKKISDESKIRISKPQNTSGYFRVSIRKGDKRYKDRILYRYLYYVDGKQKEITSVDINVLEEKVKAKGLKWLKYDDEEDIL